MLAYTHIIDDLWVGTALGLRVLDDLRVASLVRLQLCDGWADKRE